MKTGIEIIAVCPAGIYFKPTRIYIHADRIEIFCPFYKCGFRGSKGCVCKDSTEAPAKIISIKDFFNGGEK